jgi:hypothetical protein
MTTKFFKTFLLGLLIIPIIASSIGLLTPAGVFAGDEGLKDGYKNAQGKDIPPCMFTSATCANGIFTNIINTALFIIGAVSVLMLIYGGIKYTTSGGDEKAVTSSKNTILYSVVGIVIAIAAYAIVNFVVTALMK